MGVILNPPRTIGEALKRTAKTFPSRTALVSDQRRLGFAELDREADALARSLRALGVEPGDHIAILMTNDAEWVLIWLAVVRLGSTLVPINTRYRKEEVAYILQQSDAKMLFTMDSYWDEDYLKMLCEIAPEIGRSGVGPIFSEALPALRHVVTWHDSPALGLRTLKQLVQSGAESSVPLPEVDPASCAIIVYTSGTTGFPKGAMHSHIVLRNVANIAREMHIEPGDAILGHMPFYHIAGICTELLPSILLGCTLVTMPHWKPEVALDLIERERIAIFGGIPTHFIDCVDEVRRKARDTSSLKSAWIGGANVTADVASMAKHELKIRALQAVYGMTETTSTTTLSLFDDPIEVVCENKGKPVGEFEVAIFDAESGARLPNGLIGEVRVRGHIVMMGYYKNPVANAEVLPPDGWFRTGDLGAFDDQGYLKITGRLKDMFIVGGSNVYPAEIERILQAQSEVKQAIVIGVPDHRLGEVAFAFVQLVPGNQLTEQRLIERCKPLMADYKVPRYVRFVEEFPLTTTGKIQRGELSKQGRAQASSGLVS